MESALWAKWRSYSKARLEPIRARGEVLADGTYEQVSNNPAVVEAYMGSGHA